ncbi:MULTISPECIES: transposase [unclassified Streptomyces]|uniref:transposase n=1 Tax=unclassified Streptomyces TaxID=2593676 RepID=UPI002B1CB061|nr:MULTISPECIES: transposase [unclassified Streptomyces]
MFPPRPLDLPGVGFQRQRGKGTTCTSQRHVVCGASPVEHSSGKSRHRRLNRGGNRQANAALYRIVLTRLRREERTQHYLERRSAEGKTKREIIRCLKRYVAREIYQYIRGVSLPQPAPGTG